MKKVILQTLLILLLPLSAWAATYLVAAGGGGDYTTIAQVNAASFNPGDFVLFNQGDTWREQLTIPSSGTSGSVITFGTYGTGVAPRITASEDITGVSGDWADQGSNIWARDLTGTTIYYGDLVINHTFDSDASEWNLATGWVYDAIDHSIVHVAGTGTAQVTPSPTVVAQQIYRVRFTIRNSGGVGTVTARVGSQSGTAVTADGDYIQMFQPSGATALFYFIPTTDWTGNIDNIYCELCSTLNDGGTPVIFTKSGATHFGAWTYGDTKTSPAADYGHFFDVTDGKLYIYSVGNPTSYYTKIEMGVRPYAVAAISKNYVAISGLNCDGAAPPYPVRGWGASIYLYKADHITVTGCMANYAIGADIRVEGSTNCLITLNNIKGSRRDNTGTYGDGISIRSSSDVTAPDSITCTYNTLTGGYNAGGIERQAIAIVYGSNHIIQHNTIAGGFAIDIEPSIETAVCNAINISYNTLTNSSICCTGTDAAQVVSNVTVDHNTIDNGGNNITGITCNRLQGTNSIKWNTVKNTGTTVGLKLDNNANAVMTSMRHNWIENSQYVYGAVLLGESGTNTSEFISNIVTNCVRAIFNTNGTGALNVFNNTFDGYTSQGVYCYNTSSAMTLKNNIFNSGVGFSRHLELLGTISHVLDYNCYNITGGSYYKYKGNIRTLATLRSSDSQEANGMEADPLFVSATDFHIQLTSPAYLAGVATGIIPALDYFGQGWKNPPSIGANEPLGFSRIPMSGFTP